MCGTNKFEKFIKRRIRKRRSQSQFGMIELNLFALHYQHPNLNNKKNLSCLQRKSKEEKVIRECNKLTKILKKKLPLLSGRWSQYSNEKSILKVIINIKVTYQSHFLSQISLSSFFWIEEKHFQQLILKLAFDNAHDSLWCPNTYLKNLLGTLCNAFLRKVVYLP